jgi:hypothetical protein
MKGDIMRRFIIASAALGALAALSAEQAKAAPCVGKLCTNVSVAPDGCAITNTGSESLAVEMFPDDAWRAGHQSERYPVTFTLKAGEKHVHAPAIGCLLPDKNVQFWTVRQAGPEKVVKVEPRDFFGATKATPCTGDACKEVELKEVDNCLWLQSSSAKPVEAELTLESGAKIALVLEAADAAKAKRQADAGEVAVQTKQRAAECTSALTSEKLLEDLRKSGTPVPLGEIDTTASECRVEAQAREAAKKTAPVVGYHYSIYSPLSNNEYPVFRAKVMLKDACATRAELKSWSVKAAGTPATTADGRRP